MNLHTHTPTVVAVDSRGLPVRHIDYCRNEPYAHAFPRLTRQSFDAARRKLSSTDPRVDLPSSRVVHDLAGAALLTESVDAGWQLSLRGQAGQLLETWDSRNSRSCLQYDELLRVTAIAEQLQGQPWRVVERLDYGDAGEQSAAHNRCGQLSRRDDPAGCTSFPAYALTGVALIQERRFLTTLDTPDWPETMLQRDALLEAQGYRSVINVGALGDVIARDDAQGHRQVMRHTCAGQLNSIGLKLAGHDTSQTPVSDIDYNALGAVEREVAGNGVVSRSIHDEQNGRLVRLLAQSAQGQTLQDLIYTYDPVGNVLSIEDAAQAVSFFKNQRTDPVNHYVYDSLYQLIEATGREVASFSHGPALPGVQPAPMDPACLVNYTQRFDYDAGGNLLARHHSGDETWRMATSLYSNRSLPQRADGSLPDEHEIAEAFDSNGNLKMLQPGQSMTWDARNQLSEITSVKRDDGPDDSELYRYDGDGQRVRKVRVNQARSLTLTAEVRYLPGLEAHRNEATGEVRHVLTVQAGRNSVRVVHWESGKPEGIENDQLRYSLRDHLGSGTLELDDDAKLISHEGYYPFGGTAWWAARSAVEAKYKTVRYSGKEQDATGLYYYGFRYYAPWLQRWISADPFGAVQGPNLYLFVASSPSGNIEIDGGVYEGFNDSVEQAMDEDGDVIIWRGLSELQAFNPQQAMRVRLLLSQVDEIFTGAIAAANDQSWDQGILSRQYFGYYHEQAMPGVVRDWSKMQALTADYRSDHGYEKIVGIIPYEPELASVVEDDPHGRIFINMEKVQSSRFVTTLAHELTHLGSVSGFAHEGVKTEDNFYLSEKSAGTLSAGSAGQGMARVSEVIVNGGLTKAYFEASVSDEETFIEQVTKLHSQPASITGLESAIDVFNKNPHIASVMASRNADSIVEAAVSFHQTRRRALLAQRVGRS